MGGISLEFSVNLPGGAVGGGLLRQKSDKIETPTERKKGRVETIEDTIGDYHDGGISDDDKR